MRIAGVIVGLIFAFGALIAAAIELIKWVREGTYEVVSLGQIWSSIDANSLVGLGALIEKDVSPGLWTDVVVPLLSLPAWLPLGLIGLGILLAARRRPRRRHTFRS